MQSHKRKIEDDLTKRDEKDGRKRRGKGNKRRKGDRKLKHSIKVRRNKVKKAGEKPAIEGKT